jgi:AAA15 family ATPase/GTPase
MIHSIYAKNFYSVDQKTCLNFVVDAKAPKNDGYYTSRAGVRVSLVEDVIGPNASGKTNLLRILPLLKWLIVDSWANDPNGELPSTPFKPHQEEQESTELGVVFEVDGTIYTYDVKLLHNRIVLEELSAQTKSARRITKKKLFSRIYDPDKSAYALSLPGFGAPKGFKDVLRDNATILSTAIRLNHPLGKKIADYWSKTQSNIYQYGWGGSHLYGAFQPQVLVSSIKYYHEHPELKSQAEEILARYDIGFDSFRTELINNQLTLLAAHSFGESKFDLSLNDESSGTISLLVLLVVLLKVLETGGVAVIDELDASLHPEMVQELVGLFTDKMANHDHAQLLFSTHNTRILQQLDKYQIVLAEKDDCGATESWRLDEVKGVRSDDNYYVKYMSGAYGATPKIG